MTKWVRTYPDEFDPWTCGRNLVIDDTPRVFHDRNYLPVLAGLDDGTVILEWDIAVSAEDRARFAGHVAADPGRVHVAPYRIYPVSTLLPEPVWAHRHADGSWVDEGEPSCDLFGFGMTYLPLAIVRAFLATGPEWAMDASFSEWHHRSGYGPVPIHWDVRPVHLHYTEGAAGQHAGVLRCR